MQVQILKRNRGETLVSVIIGVFVLAMVISGIAAILANNLAVENDYMRNNKLHFLEVNSTNIIRRLDTSNLDEKQVFYLEKNETGSVFLVRTWSTSLPYAYVNEAGSNITNTGSYTGSIYLRTFIVDQYDKSLKIGNQIIKWTIRELIKDTR